MGRNDGSDASSFDFACQQRARSKPPAPRNPDLIFSIPSSSDEEDDDDIATLRPSPMLQNATADDATIDAQNATQEVMGPGSWSPLTASPFTPNVNSKADPGKREFNHEGASSHTSSRPQQLGLKLSKAPPSNIESGYPSVFNSKVTDEEVVLPRLRTSPRISMAPPPSVLEKARAASPTPPKTKPSKKKKKQDNVSSLLVKEESTVSAAAVPPATTKENMGDSTNPNICVSKSPSATSDEKPSKKRSAKTDHELPPKKKPSKKSTEKPAAHMDVSASPPAKKEAKQTKVPPSVESLVPKEANEHSEAKDGKTVVSKQPRGVSMSAASVHDESSTKSVAVVKSKKLNFQEQVMLHMLNAFKPFTSNSLAKEMKANESSINFVLLSLIDKGLVLQKDFTSSKGRVKTLFWANHDGKAKEVSVTVADSAMDLAEREQAQRRMLELRNQVALVRAQHQQVLQLPSNADLSRQLETEEVAWLELQQRLQEIKARIQKSGQDVSKERCPVRLKQRINHLRREWLRRRVICTEFLEELSFGLEKKMKDVLQLIDIETDDMHGAVLPAMYKVP